jgi:hypothetical protein
MTYYPRLRDLQSDRSERLENGGAGLNVKRG